MPRDTVVPRDTLLHIRLRVWETSTCQLLARHFKRSGFQVEGELYFPRGTSGDLLVRRRW